MAMRYAQRLLRLLRPAQREARELRLTATLPDARAQHAVYFDTSGSHADEPGPWRDWHPLVASFEALLRQVALLVRLTGIGAIADGRDDDDLDGGVGASRPGPSNNGPGGNGLWTDKNAASYLLITNWWALLVKRGPISQARRVQAEVARACAKAWEMELAAAHLEYIAARTRVLVPREQGSGLDPNDSNKTLVRQPTVTSGAEIRAIRRNHRVEIDIGGYRSVVVEGGECDGLGSAA